MIEDIFMFRPIKASLLPDVLTINLLLQQSAVVSPPTSNGGPVLAQSPISNRDTYGKKTQESRFWQSRSSARNVLDTGTKYEVSFLFKYNGKLVYLHISVQQQQWWNV